MFVFEETNAPYSALDEYIHKRLQTVILKNIETVDTRQYDEGSGNFHCATNQIILPCEL